MMHETDHNGPPPNTVQTRSAKAENAGHLKEPPTIGVAHVLYNFEKRYEDELTVQEGSDVRIVQVCDEWVLCWNQETGDSGIVPLTYLQISLDNESGENVIEKFETQAETSTVQELPKQPIKIKTESFTPVRNVHSTLPERSKNVFTPIRNIHSALPRAQFAASLPRLPTHSQKFELATPVQNVSIKQQVKTDEFMQRFGLTPRRNDSYQTSFNSCANMTPVARPPLPVERPQFQPMNSALNTPLMKSATPSRLPNWKEKFESTVAELLNTEIAYLNELSLWETCIKQSGYLGEYQKAVLTHGLPALHELSQFLVHSLAEQADRPIEQQELSQVFIVNREWIGRVYSNYAQSLDEINQIAKSKQGTATHEALQLCLQQVQSLGAYFFDVQTAVALPIQRIYKYSLFLNELMKVLPSYHLDHSKLVEAKKQVDSFASTLNESKSQSHIARKYQNESSSSIAEKLSKLNLHSIQKKGNRLRYRIASSFGLVDMPDPEFSWMTGEVSKAERHLDDFIFSVEIYKSRLVSMTTKFIKATTIETKKLPSQAVEVLRWEFNACLKMLSVFLQNHQQLIENEIEVPTRSLGKNDCSKLIEKRCDKMADYEMARVQKGSVDELERLRREFEALNLHLKNSLPKIWTDLNNQISLLSQKLVKLDQEFFDRVNVYLNELPVKLRIFTLPNFEKFVDPAGQRLFSFRKYTR